MKRSEMMSVRHALIVALALWWNTAVGQQPDEMIKFEIDVLPEAARYLELLTTPAYAAMALQNIGLRPSVSSPLMIPNRRSFQIKAALVRFTGRDGSMFNYEAGVSLPLGVTTSEFVVRVRVDTSAISRGKVTAHAFSPFNAFIPTEFIERVEFKIRTLANLQSQRRVIEYLDRIAAEQKDQGRGFEAMLEAIAFEAVSRSDRPGAVTAGRGHAGGEARTDQIALLILLAIWLLGFPLFLLLARMRRKWQRPA